MRWDEHPPSDPTPDLELLERNEANKKVELKLTFPSSSLPALLPSSKLSKFPNFYGEDMIRSRYDRHGIHIKEIFIPLSKNEEGKIRRNNRRFAFMEVFTEEDMRKAIMIVSPPLPFARAYVRHRS